MSAIFVDGGDRTRDYILRVVPICTYMILYYLHRYPGTGTSNIFTYNKFVPTYVSIYLCTM
jgi:hypothetical protein